MPCTPVLKISSFKSLLHFIQKDSLKKFRAHPQVVKVVVSFSEVKCVAWKKILIRLSLISLATKYEEIWQNNYKFLGRRIYNDVITHTKFHKWLKKYYFNIARSFDLIRESGLSVLLESIINIRTSACQVLLNLCVGSQLKRNFLDNAAIGFVWFATYRVSFDETVSLICLLKLVLG